MGKAFNQQVFEGEYDPHPLKRFPGGYLEGTESPSFKTKQAQQMLSGDDSGIVMGSLFNDTDFSGAEMQINSLLKETESEEVHVSGRMRSKQGDGDVFEYPSSPD